MVPETSFSVNNISAIENMDLVEKAASELIENNCVVEIPFMPIYQ